MAHSLLFSSQISCVISINTDYYSGYRGYMENSADPDKMACLFVCLI